MRFPRPSLPAAVRRAGDRPVRDAVVAPPDPRSLGTPIDPVLESIRADLRPHLRRLWVRRIVRRAWLVAGAVLVAEVALFAIGRVVPIEILSALAVAIPIVGLVILVGLAAAARPRIGETAIAVDAEARLGDRVASALALAAAFPDLRRAARRRVADADADDGGDETREAEAFVRRQRADAASSLRIAPPNLFRPRLSRRPAAAVLVASLLLVPLVLLPNPQDAAIAQSQHIRDEANAAGRRIDDIAKDLESKGHGPEGSAVAARPAAPRPRPPASHRTPTTSRRTSPACRASRPTSARSSTRRTSSGHRRWRP